MQPEESQFPIDCELKNITDLDIPSSLPETMQPKLICNFSSVHGVGQILLVCENKQKSITQFILVKHPLEFFASFRHTFPIVRINDEDDALSILEVYYW